MSRPGSLGWYIALVLSLLPALGIVRWLMTTTPGAGPQGGLLAFAALVLHLAALAAVSLAIAIRVARAGGEGGVWRYVAAVAIWLVVFGVSATLMGRWANAASLAGATPDERRRSLLAYVLLLAAVYGAQLALLARSRPTAGG